jgi:hypothetical protein
VLAASIDRPLFHRNQTYRCAAAAAPCDGTSQRRPMVRRGHRDVRAAADDLGCSARTPLAVSCAVRLYITSAYWFTASISFANPAVTIARALSDTYAGIALAGVLAFIAAQLVGMLTAVMLGRWLWSNE